MKVLQKLITGREEKREIELGSLKIARLLNGRTPNLSPEDVGFEAKHFF